MGAREILDMRLADFVGAGLIEKLEFKIEPDYSTEYSLEVPVNSGGYHFDSSFGNYLPDDPDTADVIVVEAAVLSVVLDGEKIAVGELDLDGLFDDPDAYELDFDEYGGDPWVSDIQGAIEGFIDYKHDELYDDVAWGFADRDTDSYMPAIEADPNITVRQLLDQSNAVSPVC